MLISIIIPVFNAEKYIAKCLDSVINQTYKDIEIILVNDGSTDSSGSICDAYAKRDDRVIVLHQENGGVSSARNNGLKIAKGKYIGFVDPDDWISHNMYSNLYQLMIEYNADISVCGYIMETIDSKPLNQTTQVNIIEYNREEALNNILDGFQGFACNKLFSADLIKNTPSVIFDLDIHYGEDLLFCCEIILKSKKIIFDPIPHYHYIIHENNITQSRFTPKKLTLLNALEKIIILLNNLKGVDIDKFKSLYVYSNIDLLMYGIKEKKCTNLMRKHLKQNLYKYKLSNINASKIKLSFLSARINIYLCYIIWFLYKGHLIKS
ncbi:glycosyltransferase family 2 protein [Peribacillus sp. SCS-155]|uniref:glycosyltransferase family 2 protein n=1 Tax=Peribacillus sedimenti TaxID=3115297 RepID=UPI003906429E